MLGYCRMTDVHEAQLDFFYGRYPGICSHGAAFSSSFFWGCITKGALVQLAKLLWLRGMVSRGMVSRRNVKMDTLAFATGGIHTQQGTNRSHQGYEIHKAF